MVNIFSNRMLRPLNCDQILIFTFTALESKPVKTVVALVFVTLDEVPAQYEMLCNIIDTRSDDTHGYIMPWHTPIVSLAQFVALPVLNVLEVHDSVVVKVLSGEDLILDTRRMGISQWMLPLIPATEAKIQTADEGKIEVNNDEFLVMRPAALC